jgi:ribosomal protein L7/L12
VETWWILLIAAVIALVLVLAWSARKRRSYVDPTQVTIDASLAGKVTGLYQQGKKVEAVKLLREQTGLSLADAVTIVEKIASRSKSGSNSGSKTAVKKERPPRADTAPSTAPVDLDD